jgi:hypothetical protein
VNSDTPTGRSSVKYFMTFDKDTTHFTATGYTVMLKNSNEEG